MRRMSGLRLVIHVDMEMHVHVYNILLDPNFAPKAELLTP